MTISAATPWDSVENARRSSGIGEIAAEDGPENRRAATAFRQPEHECVLAAREGVQRWSAIKDEARGAAGRMRQTTASERPATSRTTGCEREAADRPTSALAPKRAVSQRSSAPMRSPRMF